MKYGYILLVVTAVFAVRHLRSKYASPRSKCLVGGLAAFAVLGPFLWPAFLPLRGVVAWAAMPLQFAISGYVALHQIFWGRDAEPLAASFDPYRPNPSNQAKTAGNSSKT